MPVSASSASQAIPDLTFGIELEFILIGNREEIKHKLVGQGADIFFDSKGRQLVRRVLNAHNVQATAHISDDIPKTQRYQRWTVAAECTVRLTDGERTLLPDDFVAEAIKLKSPIFELRDQDYWRGEINHVLTTLQNHLNSARGLCPSVRLLVNEHCAFQVHVGKSADTSRIFTLRTIGNLYQLATGFERVIDELHSADRISESTWGGPVPSGYNMVSIPLLAPPSTCWKRDADPAISEKGTPLTWCEALEKITAGNDDPNHPKTLQRALSKMTGGSKMVAYNLNNCLIPDQWPLPAYNGTDVGGSGDTTYLSRTSPERGLNTWTIEFKQHGGTLDVRAVFAWIDVVTAMTGLAERCADGGVLGQEELHNLLKNQAEDAFFEPFEFLEDTLGVSEETRDYYDWLWELTAFDIDAAPLIPPNTTYPGAPLLNENGTDRAEYRSRISVVLELERKVQAQQYGAFDGDRQASLRDAVEAKMRDAGVGDARLFR